MKNSNLYKVLYYLCSIPFVYLFIDSYIFVYESYFSINLILGVINFLLILFFSIKSFKYKLKNINVMFPLIHLIFSALVILLTFIMNDKLIIPYIHFDYYETFILINYLLLNIYSSLSFYKRK